MPPTFRRFGLGIAAVALLTLPLQAQQLPAPPPQRIIINFILPVTPDTVNALLNIVNAQVRNGMFSAGIVGQ
jgi:hypothetical protein